LALTVWRDKGDFCVTEPRVRIDVWSDYNCPWCFLASASLEKLEASHDVEVHWHSYELRPKGSPPMPAEYRARIEANKPRLYALAREQYGLELKQGPFGIDSRPALIGAKFAEDQGVGHAYHHALMHAYWTEAQDIGDRKVLAGLAERVGLEREAFLAALDDPQVDGQVQLDIDQARELGLNSVPALVFDHRYLISGAQPYAVLVQATEHVQAELAKERV
jgi:predicted DsbA family dithiol-disulfide isomerase